MKGPEFTDYLKEEGLDSVITARQAAGEADKPAKELYARYAKLAIRSGSGSAVHLTRPVGLKAEFVPMSDPTSIHPGGTLTVQLLTEAQPVSGAAVTAASEGTSVKGQTDAQGRVPLRIDREGGWLVKTVHMARLTWSARAIPHPISWSRFASWIHSTPSRTSIRDSTTCVSETCSSTRRRCLAKAYSMPPNA
jgi:hypothetical protein